MSHPDSDGDGQPSTPNEASAAARPTAIRRAWRWGIAALVFGGAVATIMWLRGEPLRTVDRKVLDEAARLWEQANIDNYRMMVELEGRLSHRFELTVEQGVLIAAKRDGQPLPPNRLPKAWTVDGMFDTLIADATMSEMAERGESSGRFLRMLGRFDEQGLPVRYLRIEMVKQGGNPAAGWEIVSFERRELTSDLNQAATADRTSDE